MQIFVSDKVCVFIAAIKSISEFPKALNFFAKEVGVPEAIIANFDMPQENSLLVLWDYCSKRRSDITNMMAKDLFQLQGQTPLFATFGEEGDISNI